MEKGVITIVTRTTPTLATAQIATLTELEKATTEIRIISNMEENEEIELEDKATEGTLMGEDPEDRMEVMGNTGNIIKEAQVVITMGTVEVVNIILEVVEEVTETMEMIPARIWVLVVVIIS